MKVTFFFAGDLLLTIGLAFIVTELCFILYVCSGDDILHNTKLKGCQISACSNLKQSVLNEITVHIHGEEEVFEWSHAICFCVNLICKFTTNI